MPLQQRIHAATSMGFPVARPSSDLVEESKRIDRVRSVCGSHRTAGSIGTPAEEASEPRSDTIEKTSCTYQGQTFFGDFCVSGRGPNAVVSVHHHGQELEAKVGNASIEAAAEALLQEMVIRDMISMVVGKR